MNVATWPNTQSPALHAADGPDLLRVHSARVNNLKDVSVEIPKRRLKLFTGVFGSGKCSLVFDTIAAAADQRDPQRVRAGLHADACTAGGRCAGGLTTASRSLAEGALTIPGFSMDGWYGRISWAPVSSTRTSRSGITPRPSCTTC